MKKTLALLLAVLLVVGIMPVTAKADSDGVTVYISISNNDEYVNTAAPNKTPTVMAFKEITVPYFDIGVYGLSNFYYNPSCYSTHDHNPANQVAGTSTTADGHVTLLHVMIYALEVFYYENDPDNVGDLVNHTTFDPSALSISGTAGSIYFTNYWGMNYNLEYFVDYSCPEAYSNWGKTADQIVLDNTDGAIPIVSIGHFSDLGFFTDSNGIFTYAVPTSNGTISAGTEMTSNSMSLTFKHAFANLIMNDSSTSQTAYGSDIPVFCCNVNNISSGDLYDSDVWTYLGDTDANGAITITTSAIGANSGTFLVAIPGQPGSEAPYNICSTPGGILVTINLNQ